jgi:hypothetical protein
MRRELLNTVKIPDGDLMLILKQVAKLNKSTKMWDFLLPVDEGFMKKYPEIVTRQKMLWDSRHTQLERLYNSTSVKKEVTSVGESARFPSPRPQGPGARKRRRSRRDSVTASGTDENESSGTESVDNPNGIRAPKREHKSPSPSKSPTSVRKIQSSRLANGVHETTLHKESRSKVATLEINPTLDVNPSPEQMHELVKVVRDKLRLCCCLNITELRELITASPSCRSLVSGSCFNERVIESAVIEAEGFRVQGNKWPQHTTPQPLYAFTKFGENDWAREALIEMFSEKTRVRLSLFESKVQDKIGDDASSFCKNLLKSYCVYKSSQYYLKGTIEPPTKESGKKKNA